MDGFGLSNDLIQFIRYAFLGNDSYAVRIFLNSLQCFFFNGKILKLGGKTDCPHHTQWIIAECLFRVQAVF